MFKISEVDKDDSNLVWLVSELDAFQSELYPAESNHCLDLLTVSDEQLRCIIVHDHDGSPAGCGALLFQADGSAEIKRVYIRLEYRGRKLGEQIVSAIETIASEKSSRLLRLETGIYQQPAIALYRRCGYEMCDAFPPYTADPLSVFMCKELL
ncbi:GNAT family N-acetyltransferase [Yersinia intermedia]|uniref:N-acetyltransferase n=1 Tax=Yersinia intermedia TaxID=631 RepID=A0A208ZRC3_YERIN|nr:GNAT family N-acetyltransferase [Yersinia intermedia]OVZ83044.1 N-acetyltransferase [Yersinia intermedia]WET16426.1 GNAT family N-acetyltransferase [Yersinia intermedia]CQJ67154.1 Histone acetyltransferase HPA2 and acetyltransferase [Yersinia intermedia]